MASADEAARGGPEGPGPEHADGHDWEVLEGSSHSLSPCGSSPRCLSDMEQEQAPAAAPPALAQPDLQPPAAGSAPDEPASDASDASSQTDELSRQQEEAVSSESEPELERDAEQAEGSQAPSSQPHALAGSQLLSGASSYADLSGSESAGTGAASCALPESHAPPGASSSSASDAGASDSEARLLEGEHLSESQAPSEASVMGSEAELERPKAQAAGELQAAPAPPAPEPVAAAAERPAAAAAPAPGEAAASPAVGQGLSVAEFLEWLGHLGWESTVQVLNITWAQVLRAGTLLPQKLRCAMRAALAQLRQQLPGGGGDGGSDVPKMLLVFALALAYVLLAKSRFTAAGLRRELAERDALLSELYLQVLRLSTKLNRSMDIPVTSHCAFKTRASLSGAMF